MAIVGESGSGKSLTALSIMRLLSPAISVDAGRIRFDDQDLMSLDEDGINRLRGDRISMIFQEPLTALNPTMRVGDQVAEVLITHKGLSHSAARAEAIRLLEGVEIRDAAKRHDYYPHQFSGGMRQRVMIAMALACRPRLLIADEPTTALDVTVQAQIIELLRRLQREIQSAILFISHDLALVGNFCDRIAVMSAGRIVESGATREVLLRPRHDYTRNLLACRPPEIGQPRRSTLRSEPRTGR
ncbi:MAG: ATP-binding cassette domain-containing protein [Bradyrhizobium sp.]|uniref:ATP-binding cassette domain-containing protein n=1 Tax=Bradyrhizobium sp. TaxID=376 RepID=UPI003D0B6656